jgi:hypothetical protein
MAKGQRDRVESMEKPPELIAPAGDWVALRAAVPKMAPRLLSAALLVLTGCLAHGPRLLSTHASLVGANGLARIAAHAGVDIASRVGAPILAAADGEVHSVDFDPKGCGLAVLLAHPEFLRFTLYCHLGEVRVRVGQEVRRGEVLGQAGSSGNTGGILHLHWELCRRACPRGHADGDLAGTLDPLPLLAGCHVPFKTYPGASLVLTWPVSCTESLEHRPTRAGAVRAQGTSASSH